MNQSDQNIPIVRLTAAVGLILLVACSASEPDRTTLKASLAAAPSEAPSEAMVEPIFPAAASPAGALETAQAALNEQRYRKALTSFQRAATVAPREPAALRGTAISLFQLGQYREASQYFRRVLTSAPNSAEAHFDLATALAAQGLRGEAVSHYRRALQLDPNHGDAALNLGLLYVGLGKRAEAVNMWREAENRGVRSAGIQHALGVSAFENGKLDDASARFKRALEIDPGFRLAVVGLGNVALRRGDLTQAMRYWADASKLASQQSKSSPFRAAALARSRRIPFHLYLGVGTTPDSDQATEASNALRSGELSGAISAYQKLLAATPNDGGLLTNLGLAFALSGDIKQAIEYWNQVGSNDAAYDTARYNKSIALFAEKKEIEGQTELEELVGRNPNFAMALHALGASLIRTRQFPQALQALNRAVTVDAKSAEIRNELGIALFRSGDIAGAAREFEKATQSQPGLSPAQFNYGVIMLELNRFQEGLRIFRELIKQSPQDAELHVNLGYGLAMTGNLDNAMLSWKEAIRLDPQQSLAQNNLGVGYFLKGRYNEALNYFDAAIEYNPALSDPFNNQAATFLKLNRPVDAMRAYEKAVRANPEDREARRNLGSLYLMEGRFDGAAENLRAAIALDPSDADALFNLGVAYQGLGKRTEAVALFEEFLRIASDRPELHRASLKAEQAVRSLKPGG